MATTIPSSTRSAAALVQGDQCVTLRGIDWKGYLTILRLRGERPVPRMIYCDGELLLVSPSYIHERLSELLGIFIIEVVVGLEIPCTSAGSTTFRRRAKRGGVEGDKTFYLANQARVHGKNEIDLRNDPPPDLAIEAVHTHEVAAAIEVYRRLGVPEVWVCDGEKLRILVRQANGRYARADSSAAFPFLEAAEVFAWVTRPDVASDTDWVKELRRWVRDTLVPRRAGLQP
jgi:Uma2 family endonuclease